MKRALALASLVATVAAGAAAPANAVSSPPSTRTAATGQVHMTLAAEQVHMT